MRSLYQRLPGSHDISGSADLAQRGSHRVDTEVGRPERLWVHACKRARRKPRGIAEAGGEAHVQEGFARSVVDEALLARRAWTSHGAVYRRADEANLDAANLLRMW